MIRLNCFIKVPVAHRTEVLEAAKRLTQDSRTQAGCIGYDIFESATCNEVMMICETWSDQTALDNHAASPEFKRESGLMHSLAEMTLDRYIF